ncbi:three-helix bundle dimerization domain-containing protein [Mycobacterium sp. IDR2000157661]|uniref:three-helix bundle dimerization domain-containing protein n=1 Tax=Mycobacterium sp. IDR2000157661 TaxID=2867005 RepID=UPI001EEB2721|nr:hypothetical protein [Mycobacterium sp. IDR2000157661]ULE33430.1 hypothetical protein K3G64_01520 [Mycobacterium sp. IDR2000157661]
MAAFAEPLVHDELESLVCNLCAKYPERSRVEVERVVAAVYAEIVAQATVTSHVIPLTLNRSRRLLALSVPDESGGPRLALRGRT